MEMSVGAALRALEGKLGSGRCSSYTGRISAWPREGRKFSFVRSGTRKSRTYLTSTVKEVRSKTKDKGRVLKVEFVTKHGTVYEVTRVT